jgi:hypothetical protein
MMIQLKLDCCTASCIASKIAAVVTIAFLVTVGHTWNLYSVHEKIEAVRGCARCMLRTSRRTVRTFLCAFVDGARKLVE